MRAPKQRNRRFAEIRRALDESDREEWMEEQDDSEAMAQKWEKVVKQDAFVGGQLNRLVAHHR